MQASKGAPVPTPPGLEVPVSETVDATSSSETPAEAAAQAAAARAAAETLEEKLTQLGLGAPETHEFLQDIKAVIDIHVASKAEELKLWGVQAITQVNKRLKERTSELSEELARCRERQARLEAENDQLKQLLQHLAQRFQVLGAIFSTKAVPDPMAVAAAASVAAESAATAAPVPPGPDSAGAPASPGVSQEGPNAPFTEPQLTPGPDQAAGTGPFDGMAPVPKMPEVPPFPFPTQPSPTAAPLLLAEALGGAQTPSQRTQLNLAASLTPSTVPAPEAFGGARSGLGFFTFTLRKADGADLGLNVSHYEHDRALRIEGVRPEGAVEAWNRQCQGSVSAEKVVQKGDKIISVNNVSYDPVKMLEECRDKQLLRLTIVRGERPSSVAASKAAAATKASTTMRAEATVFIPKGADTPTSPEKDGEKAEANGDREAESTAASAGSSLQATPESGKAEAVNERV